MDLGSDVANCVGPPVTDEVCCICENLVKSSVARVVMKTCSVIAFRREMLCSSPVDLSKKCSDEIPCRSTHLNCLKCLAVKDKVHIDGNTPSLCPDLETTLFVFRFNPS